MWFMAHQKYVFEVKYVGPQIGVFDSIPKRNYHIIAETPKKAVEKGDVLWRNVWVVKSADSYLLNSSGDFFGRLDLDFRTIVNYVGSVNLYNKNKVPRLSSAHDRATYNLELIVSQKSKPQIKVTVK